jgi:hypothetical protein
MLSDQILLRMLRRLVTNDPEIIPKEILSRRLPRDTNEDHTEPSAFVRPKFEPLASK